LTVRGTRNKLHTGILECEARWRSRLVRRLAASRQT